MAYELVPEAYRQKFCGHVKAANQTFVEFAREKGNLFDKWCQSSKVNNFEQLRELVLLEDFKTTLPDKIVVYLNEQKENKLVHAAVSEDEFVLTHKNVFVSSVRREFSQFEKSPKNLATAIPNQGDSRECFYCRETGHLIAGCPVLKRKNQSPNSLAPKSVGFACAASSPVGLNGPGVDAGYVPFVSSGVVFLTGQESVKVPIRILRDTGSAQSFVLGKMLPFSKDSYWGSDVLVQGIELGIVRVPLHRVTFNLTLFLILLRLLFVHNYLLKGLI